MPVSWNVQPGLYAMLAATGVLGVVFRCVAILNCRLLKLFAITIFAAIFKPYCFLCLPFKRFMISQVALMVEGTGHPPFYSKS